MDCSCNFNQAGTSYRTRVARDYVVWILADERYIYSFVRGNTRLFACQAVHIVLPDEVAICKALSDWYIRSLWSFRYTETEPTFSDTPQPVLTLIALRHCRPIQQYGYYTSRRYQSQCTKQSEKESPESRALYTSPQKPICHHRVASQCIFRTSCTQHYINIPTRLSF